MRVTFLYDHPVPAGAAALIQILNTGRALAETGTRVSVLTGRWSAPDEVSALAFYGLEPHPRLTVRPFFDGRPYGRDLDRRLAPILDRGSPEERHVLVLRGEQGLLLYRRLPRRRPDGLRVVFEAHRLCAPQVTEWAGPRVKRFRLPRVGWERARVRGREKRLVREADGLVCVTEGVLAAYREMAGTVAPALVLPSGTRIPRGEIPGDDARDLDVLYVGKLVRRKGVDDLVRAMARLPGRVLTLVGGDGDEEPGLRRLAETEGVADRVRFAGPVSPAEVPALLGRARVGVCPLPTGVSVISDRFTCPLKVLEMMAHGVPQVGTDVPTLRAILRDGRTALLVRPNDPADLAAGIGSLLADRPRAHALAAAARLEAPRCAWSERAARYRDFLETLP